MKQSKDAIKTLHTVLSQHIIGQEKLVTRLLIALLADGHLLVEGAPGLAKTKAIQTLADHVEGDFHRIQFTPDLLPADLTGTDIYRPQDGTFIFQQGPLFHHLILADEINRAPAKVQSALLEAMSERQISIGKTTYPLPDLFLVMATQNPLEQEGTYPLPEAQLDRFLMHVFVDYPNADAEQQILHLVREEARSALHNKNAATTTSESDKSIDNTDSKPILNQVMIFAARQAVLDVHLATELETYLVQIVLATRHADQYDTELAGWIQCGASPRATIALDRCARAHAWLNDRDYVSPDDIQSIAHDVLRHRIILSFTAEAEGITPDTIINKLLSLVPVP